MKDYSLIYEDKNYRYYAPEVVAKYYFSMMTQEDRVDVTIRKEMNKKDPASFPYIDNSVVARVEK